jgi:hypothetical protein
MHMLTQQAIASVGAIAIGFLATSSAPAADIPVQPGPQVGAYQPAPVQPVYPPPPVVYRYGPPPVAYYDYPPPVVVAPGYYRPYRFAYGPYPRYFGRGYGYWRRHW